MANECEKISKFSAEINESYFKAVAKDVVVQVARVWKFMHKLLKLFFERDIAGNALSLKALQFTLILKRRS